MALNRVLQVDIGANGTGLRVSGLDMSFKVNRSQKFADNTAELTIINASQETRAAILREGNNVTIRAGYSDQNVGVIFLGNVIQATDGKDGTDQVTTILASATRATDQPLTRTEVSLSYAALTALELVLRDLGDMTGLVVTGAENLVDAALSGNWAYAGSWRGALRDVEARLKAHGVGIYVDNAEIVAYRFGGLSNYTAALLTYDNGLVKVGDITEAFDPSARDKKGQPHPKPPKRISFEGLLNWRMRPNGLIKVQTADLTGVFLVEKLEFSGDNYGGDFKVCGEATEGAT